MDGGGVVLLSASLLVENLQHLDGWWLDVGKDLNALVIFWFLLVLGVVGCMGAKEDDGCYIVFVGFTEHHLLEVNRDGSDGEGEVGAGEGCRSNVEENCLQ